MTKFYTKNLSSIQVSAASLPIREKEKNLWFPLTICLAALGFLGVLACMFSMYQPNCQKIVVFSVSGATFFLASLCFCSHSRRGDRICGILVLLVLGILAAAGNHTAAGIQFLINDIYQIAHNTDIVYFTVDAAYSEPFCITIVCSGIGALLGFFFVYITVRRPLFLIPALVCFLLLEPGLYEGIALKPLAAAPLLAYLCGMLTLRLTLHQKPEAFDINQNIAAVCGSCMALLVLLVYGIVLLCGTAGNYSRSETDKLRRRELSRSLSAFDIQNLPDSLRSLGSAVGLYDDTQVSKLGEKNSLVYTDEVALELTFDALPEHIFYLKGFTGTVYEDNSWLASTDFSDAENATVVSTLLENYDCAPQNFSFLFQQSLSPDSTLLTCSITPLISTSRCYQPYASYSDSILFTNDLDAIPADTSCYDWTISVPSDSLSEMLRAAPLKTYTFVVPQTDDPAVQQFLYTLEMTDDTVMISARFSAAQTAQTPEEISNKVVPAMLMESTVYRDYAADAYTQLPDEDTLKEVYAALPEEIIAQKNPETAAEQLLLLQDLRAWMAEETEYTLSPGKTPATRDFINFFLLENKQGYCTHYAAAGTILARYLGIPARYCEGYLVDPTNADGTTIQLTDRQSHAWCEIYLDGYGWTPFEMTPGYYTTASFSAEESQAETEFAETAATEAGTENAGAGVEASAQTAIQTTTVPAETNSSNAADESADDGTFTLPEWLKGLLTTLCAAGILAGIFFLWRILYRRRQEKILLDTKNPHRAILEAYHMLLRLLRFCRLPYQGELLLDYQKKVSSKLHKQHLPDEAVQQIIPLTLAADMGRQSPTKAEQYGAVQALRQFRQAIYQSRSPLLRLCMKVLLLN